MPFDPQQHHRRSIRLAGYHYAAYGAYFVTILTAKRKHLFGHVTDAGMHLNATGLVAERCWLSIPAHFPHVTLDAFVIMPNHIHGILFFDDRASAVSEEHMEDRVVRARYIVPLHGEPRSFGKPDTGDLSTVIRTFKAAVTRQIGQQISSDQSGLWHRNYYEKIIRNERMLDAIRDYIKANPANWRHDEYHGT